MPPPDIVIPIRPGNRNEELRYSLRTIETNYPSHGEIWAIGFKPDWLINVRFIPGNRYRGNKAVYDNVLFACEHPDVSDECIVFNDDFFVTSPLDEIPIYHHGSLIEQCEHFRGHPRTWWHRSLLLTLEELQRHGHPVPTSYEIHSPLPINKQNMAEVLRKFVSVEKNGVPVQWRTVYGNFNNIDGIEHADCKDRRGTGPVLEPFHSTTDQSFRFFRKYYAEKYPRPSRYEKVT